MRRFFTGLRRWFNLRMWLMAHDYKDCKIHRSIEIIGREKFSEFIVVKPYTVIEKDCCIWIAKENEARPALTIGDRVYVGRNTYLGVYMPITIGNDTIIGAYTYIISANHETRNVHVPIREQGYAGAAIVIGENVWIGSHVVLLPGVTIGDGAIIAAGAVLTNNVGSNEVWAGVPARKIKDRQSEK